MFYSRLLSTKSAKRLIVGISLLTLLIGISTPNTFLFTKDIAKSLAQEDNGGIVVEQTGYSPNNEEAELPAPAEEIAVSQVGYSPNLNQQSDTGGQPQIIPISDQGDLNIQQIGYSPSTDSPEPLYNDDVYIRQVGYTPYEDFTTTAQTPICNNTCTTITPCCQVQSVPSNQVTTMPIYTPPMTVYTPPTIVMSQPVTMQPQNPQPVYAPTTYTWTDNSRFNSVNTSDNHSRSDSHNRSATTSTSRTNVDDRSIRGSFNDSHANQFANTGSFNDSRRNDESITQNISSPGNTRATIRGGTPVTFVPSNTTTPQYLPSSGVQRTITTPMATVTTSSAPQIRYVTQQAQSMADCPSGYSRSTSSDGTIICTATSAAYASSNAYAGTGATNAVYDPNTTNQPKVVYSSGASSDVKELPKTGLPLAALGLGSLVPIGLKLKKLSQASQVVTSANSIWQERLTQKIS